MNTPIQFNTKIEDLNVGYGEVSLEEFALTQQIVNAVREIPKFADTVFGFIKERLGIAELSFVPANLSVDAYEESTKRVNYVTLSPVEIFAPAGLRTDLSGGILEYVRVLDKAQMEMVIPLIQSVLIPANKYFSTLASDPTKLNSARDIYSGFNIEFGDIEQNRKAIGACFGGSHARDRMVYKNAFRRHADLLTTIKDLNELNARQAMISEKEILRLVNEIATAVDVLGKKVASDDHDFPVDKRTMNDISRTLYLIARSVDFYASYSYNLMALTTAMKDNGPRLAELTK